MKITGTKSYIIVELNGKCIKIEGELTQTSIFYADESSINYWEFDNERIYLTDEEKLELIELIIHESGKKGNIKIIFD
ncbi:MAG: hypothetical protein WBB24_16565 [Maribacter sp.]